MALNSETQLLVDIRRYHTVIPLSVEHSDGAMHKKQKQAATQSWLLVIGTFIHIVIGHW